MVYMYTEILKYCLIKKPQPGNSFHLRAYHIVINNQYIKNVFILVLEMTCIKGCIVFSLLMSVTCVQRKGMMLHIHISNTIILFVVYQFSLKSELDVSFRKFAEESRSDFN